jgi:hypothetical protein
MKTFLAAILLLCSSSLMAQVVSVNVYQPLPGMGGLTAEYMREGKAIQEAMGATVAISNDLKGIYRYAMIFDNWQGYAQFVQRLQANEAWGAFQTKISNTPSAVQIDNLQLNLFAAGSRGGAPNPGTVTDVTVWEVTTGTMGELLEGATTAKAIHERAGANVTIYTAGGLGRMYYLMQYPDFATWGRNRDTPNPEFNAFMAEINASAVNGDTGAAIILQDTLIGL